MIDFSWLTARPIAHRGFHDAAAGRVENTLSAFSAAAERGFSAEMDVHLSADGELFVFHDDTLDRLTAGSGPVRGLTLAELQSTPFKGTGDRIPTLKKVLEVVDGRIGLVIELKSYFGERQRDIVEKVAAILAGYRGPVVVKSFDPRQIEDLAAIAPELPRGIVADDAANPAAYNDYRYIAREVLAGITHRNWSKIQFVSYWVRLLPNEVSCRVREEWKMPLISWTVRNAEDRLAASRHADQMIFEGFDPDAAEG